MTARTDAIAEAFHEDIPAKNALDRLTPADLARGHNGDLPHFANLRDGDLMLTAADDPQPPITVATCLVMALGFVVTAVLGLLAWGLSWFIHGGAV